MAGRKKTIQELAAIGNSQLIPEKSRESYFAAFAKFEKWQAEHEAVGDYSEDTLLAYFVNLREMYAPTTLWSIQSKIKAVLIVKFNYNIKEKCPKLYAYLKGQNKGHIKKKAPIFTSGELSKFLTEADVETYLIEMIICIFGILGATRCDELVHMKPGDVQEKGDILLVHIPKENKTKKERYFTVSSPYVEIVKYYMSLRPPGQQDRFFLNWNGTKVTKQPIGIHTFQKAGKVVASFLNLKNAEKYTGHSFRRSSASILAEAGADIQRVQNHGGWDSPTVAQGYIDHSEKYKQDTEMLITNMLEEKTSKQHENITRKQGSLPTVSKDVNNNFSSDFCNLSNDSVSANNSTTQCDLNASVKPRRLSVDLSRFAYKKKEERISTKPSPTYVLNAETPTRPTSKNDNVTSLPKTVVKPNIKISGTKALPIKRKIQKITHTAPPLKKNFVTVPPVVKNPATEMQNQAPCLRKKKRFIPNFEIDIDFTPEELELEKKEAEKHVFPDSDSDNDFAEAINIHPLFAHNTAAMEKSPLPESDSDNDFAEAINSHPLFACNTASKKRSPSPKIDSDNEFTNAIDCHPMFTDTAYNQRKKVITENLQSNSLFATAPDPKPLFSSEQKMLSELTTIKHAIFNNCQITFNITK